MDSTEARERLSLYRPGVDEATDVLFAEALELARQDPDLSRWLLQEQALDAALATKINSAPIPPNLKTNLLALEQTLDADLAKKLKTVPIPSGLKTSLLALDSIIAPPGNRWRRPWRPFLAGTAVSAVVTWLATLTFMHQVSHTKLVRVPIAQATPSFPQDNSPKTEAGSLEDFRAEMISFIKITPPLEFESKDPDKLRDYLRRERGPTDIRVPNGMLQLPGMGCRVLSFRGYKVGLMCFQRKNGQLVHLITIDQAALPNLTGTRSQPLIGPEGAWMTAAWKEDSLAYLVAVKGDVPLLNSYLAQSIDGLPSVRVLLGQGAVEELPKFVCKPAVPTKGDSVP